MAGEWDKGAEEGEGIPRKKTSDHAHTERELFRGTRTPDGKTWARRGRGGVESRLSRTQERVERGRTNLDLGRGKSDLLRKKRAILEGRGDTGEGGCKPEYNPDGFFQAAKKLLAGTTLTRSSVT